MAEVRGVYVYGRTLVRQTVQGLLTRKGVPSWPSAVRRMRGVPVFGSLARTSGPSIRASSAGVRCAVEASSSPLSGASPTEGSASSIDETQ